jgi:2-C-methyl-D-erythritol 4-phosphate cytidylyltransferase
VSEVGVVVAAAGSGTRLGRGSKAFVELGGRTLLEWALDLFDPMPEVDRIVVVGPPTRLDRVRAVVGRASPRTPIEVCAGGESRQASVRLGLSRLEGVELVLVHDAARPLATRELVRRVLAAARQTGAALPGLACRDAVKRVEGGLLADSLDRTRLVLAQTPQGFRYRVLERAHFQAADSGLVGDDDAQLVAAAGHPVVVVPGDPGNLKLTAPEDLELMEALLRARSGR